MAGFDKINFNIWPTIPTTSGQIATHIMTRNINIQSSWLIHFQLFLLTRMFKKHEIPWARISASTKSNHMNSTQWIQCSFENKDTGKPTLHEKIQGYQQTATNHTPQSWGKSKTGRYVPRKTNAVLGDSNVVRQRNEMVSTYLEQNPIWRLPRRAINPVRRGTGNYGT